MAKKESTPLIVSDPITGRSFDVRPFFDLMEDGAMNGPKEAAENIEEIMDFMVLNIDEEHMPPLELKNCIFHLKLLKSMFRSTTEMEKKR